VGTTITRFDSWPILPEQPGTERLGDCVSAVVAAGILQQPVDLVLDGLLSRVRRNADISISPAICQQLKD
jgi:hypothetical protein